MKAAFKTGASKVPRPWTVLPSLLRPICQACVNSQLSPTPPSPPRGMEKKNVTKMNFSSSNDHSPNWIINDCYIFFPYLRVWVFLFLWASFFTENTLVLCYNNTSNVRHISWSNFKFSTPWSDPNFSTLWSDATSLHHGRTPTSQHHCRYSTESFSKSFKFSGPSLLGMTSSTLQLHFLSGGLLWQSWLS